MNTRTGPRLEVVRVQDDHAEMVAEFIRQVWDSEATAVSVLASRAIGAAKNTAEPGVAPPTWIAVQDGRVLGYVTTLPIRLWDGVREWPAYLIKGLMVLPEFRGGPIGYLVLKAAVASLPRSGALAVAPPARRLFEALGFRDLGAVPNWARPVAPGRILHRLDPAGLGFPSPPRWAAAALHLARRTGLATVAGWAGGVALRATAAMGRLSENGPDAGEFDPKASVQELDSLWDATRSGIRSAVVRDARYLTDRYAGGARDNYVWLAARRQATLVGVAILRRPRADGDERLKGIGLATLADVLYPLDQPAIGLALLGAVERSAQLLGADAILATTSAPAFSAVLRRQWYMPLSGNVHFLVRDVAGQATTFGQALSDWWTSRGDGQADDDL